MNYEKIKELIEHDKKGQYISYLKKLEKETTKENGKYILKNTWFTKFSEDHYAELYNEVLGLGVWIDGVTITLTVRGLELGADFNYQAYKNLVLSRYPESVFDFQLVYEGDTFSFRKDSGTITYTHSFGNPFGPKTIIGAYGIIKNSTGQFIELLNMEDITKLRNAAKTDKIWAMWFDQMVMKSIIKRICKVNFRDITHSIDEYDNGNYAPENADFDYQLREEINRCITLPEITAIYNREKGKSKDLNKLTKICTERKKDIEVKPHSPEWTQAIELLKTGTLIGDIKKMFYISQTNIDKLLEDSI